MTEALLQVAALIKHYPVRAGVLRRRVGTVRRSTASRFSVGPRRERLASSANPAAASRRWRAA